jgi:cellulose synthase/poly-beta-1,6-N-acetylglucosamine synthase-like glycosyltransferase
MVNLVAWNYWVQFSLACFALLTACYILLAVVLNRRYVQKLRDVPIPALSQWPKISLIAPARNEERNIEVAMRSLLAIDYPNLQITVINDRSTDRTGEILQRLAAEDARLNVVEVTVLPPGWLGKNHAMHLGAARSDGEWLLFADADIVFEPTTLRRAIGYVQQHKLDHLSAYPDARLPHWLLNAFIVTFAMMFTVFVRPWQVRNPKSRAYIGIGAFNLVRAEAYRAVGGHEPIRMRPDDDLKLGHLLKKNGYRSDVVNGLGCVIVEWYSTLGELIRGFEKNSAAPVDYNAAIVLAACVFLFVTNLWPFVAVFITWGWPQLLYGLTILTLLTAATLTAADIRHPLWSALVFPWAVTIFFYINVRGIFLLYYRGGIQWRDTFYSLAELKANRI